MSTDAGLKNVLRSGLLLALLTAPCVGSCVVPQTPQEVDYHYPAILPAAYPKFAITAHQSGQTLILAVLDPAGHVVQAKVWFTSGLLDLDREALTTVKGRPFQPCPVTNPPRDRCYVTIPVTFELPH